MRQVKGVEKREIAIYREGENEEVDKRLRKGREEWEIVKRKERKGEKVNYDQLKELGEKIDRYIDRLIDR